MSEVKQILVLGAGASLAKEFIQLILEKDDSTKIIAVDSRPLNYTSSRITSLTIKYKKSEFERIFRDYSIDSFFHIGRISHTKGVGRLSLAKRLNLNVINTSILLELCAKHGVSQVMILSTFHVYGALATNPVFIKEDAPMLASIKYHDLQDVVQMDQIATSWMWKNKEKVNCIILRPSNIVGPNSKNSMTRYLSLGQTFNSFTSPIWPWFSTSPPERGREGCIT